MFNIIAGFVLLIATAATLVYMFWTFSPKTKH